MYKNKYLNFLIVNLGAFITALGFNIFMLKNHIVTGGLGGLSISLHTMFGWSPSMFIAITNIPLLILCYFFLGSNILAKTFYTSWIYPIYIYLTSYIPTVTSNQFLASLYGGAIVGFGLGLVFLGNASTGGTGILVQILEKYTPLPLSIGILITDGSITLLTFFTFDADTFMYSIIGLFLTSYVINLMQAGYNASRNLLIISNQSKIIKNHIKKVTDRGVTEIPIIGGYSGHSQVMLMTTISRFEFPKLKREISDIDNTAFIVVMPANQVLGRGFSLTKYHISSDNEILRPM